MDTSGLRSGGARNGSGSEARLTREARVLVVCGLVMLFGGLFSAVFSDSRLDLFLGIALAVTGSLMALPHMVAGAIARMNSSEAGLPLGCVLGPSQVHAAPSKHSMRRAF